MQQIGVGVIGLGTWGETHLKAFTSHPGARLIGVCDSNAALAKQRANEYGASFVTADYRALLARDDIGAVGIATPDFLHRDMAIAAAEAGKHILLEKPMATTVEDCLAIQAAAETAGTKLMVDFHNRFSPPFLQMKAAIEAGEMGELQLISLRLNDTIFVPTQMLSWAARSTVAWFIGSHSVDLVRWLSGEEVEQVYAVSRSRVLAARGVDTPDFYLTSLELSGGLVAQIENCWILSEQYPTVFDFKAEVVGSRGTMMADVSTHRMVQKYTEDTAMYPDVIGTPDVHGRPTGFAIESIRHFVDCIVGDKELVVTAADGIAATRVICAIEESARTGAPVSLT